MDNSLVHPKEKRYFAICAIISALLYLALIFSIVGMVYILIFAVLGFLIEGMMVGGIKGNAIRVGPAQFPALNEMVERIAGNLELPKLPAVYVLQSGGILNAFAMRFLRRDFVVIYSDILELAEMKGEAALEFIVGHELGHLKLGHLTKRPWLYPALLMPFLGGAYYRACEYSADRCGHRNAGKDSVDGLLVLAAGKRLFKKVDEDALIEQAETERGFFVWFAEKLATHPNLGKRVRELRRNG